MSDEIIVEFPRKYYEMLDATFERIEAQRTRQANPDIIDLMVFNSGRLKVEIFANEHPPPHFRVKFKNETANFRIKDCVALNGNPTVIRNIREIRKWWSKNKQHLIDVWDESRPADCTVGKYVE